MTADAKVGLLLGLFFIVIIAFLVNGLPNFIKQENPTPAPATIINSTGPDIALDPRVSDTINHRLYPDRQRRRQTPMSQETVQLDPQPGIEERANDPHPTPRQQTPVVINNNELIDNHQPVGQTVAPAPARVRMHVVKSGEILPIIAKKYYGPEQGNRRIVIKRLYEINKNVLKSPDQVHVGDKLKVPLRVEELLNTSETVIRASGPSQTLMDEHPDVFEAVAANHSPSFTEYAVQKGDNLWTIAEQILGDGQRYRDIEKLNKDRLRNANDLREGLKLRIPPK